MFFDGCLELLRKLLVKTIPPDIGGDHKSARNRKSQGIHPHQVGPFAAIGFSFVLPVVVMRIPVIINVGDLPERILFFLPDKIPVRLGVNRFIGILVHLDLRSAFELFEKIDGSHRGEFFLADQGNGTFVPFMVFAVKEFSGQMILGNPPGEFPLDPFLHDIDHIQKLAITQLRII
ncbi:MAG: hypothetical protein BWY49_00660 [Candidatus Omnitrophica bacterium ADurb.Bin314]|nr:MAG: hypothetical protein BWY49_00660 [Candidatus Omnitrophica bacterium ADurb.Bin314]